MCSAATCIAASLCVWWHVWYLQSECQICEVFVDVVTSVLCQKAGCYVLCCKCNTAFLCLPVEQIYSFSLWSVVICFYVQFCLLLLNRCESLHPKPMRKGKTQWGQLGLHVCSRNYDPHHQLDFFLYTKVKLEYYLSRLAMI